MIFNDRRFVILVFLGVFISGTAIASRKFSQPSPSGEMSANGLLETAGRRERTRNQPPATNVSVPQTPADPPKSARREFTIYRNEQGEIVCREATPDEIRARQGEDLNRLGLRQINHLELDKSVSAQAPAATNLVIVLRATQQLQQNAAAVAAFNRAAQNWESIITSPITIYIDVDFGPTGFGQQFPPNVLGGTGAPSSSFPYQSVRTNLNAEATGEGNATKQAIFNGLPANSVPTDLGSASSVDVYDSIARAIGLLPATAQPADDAAQIAFNSGNKFDFDPSDGITADAIDFDAVATHEIGHALGFDSDAGENIPKPTIWDLYRFHSGTTSATFPTAQRIMTTGASTSDLQFDFIPGNPELGLSTGGPDGNGGDQWQSSHWKHVSSCTGYIGIMDPAIGNGCRRTITSNDILALGSFGYNLTNSNQPPPPPPSPTPPANDNFANAQVISGCSGSVNGSTFGATKEAGEPNHDPGDSTALTPNHSIWYQWQAPSSGSTTITTAGSDFDTILAIYTGSTVTNLTFACPSCFNDDVQNGVIRTSSKTFTATAGTVYMIAIDGWGGDVGSVKLNWNGCATPSPSPTPTPSPSPTPTPSPSPSPTPTVTPVVSPFPTPTPIPAGQAVAYQINPAHTGAQTDNVTPPLTKRWSRDLGGPVSYPAIVGGTVFVTVGNAFPASGTRLFAINETTGANVWGPIDVSSSRPWSNLAYDGGRLFVVNFDGLLRAFDAATGNLIWSKQLPGQSSFSTAPTAFGGMVYVSGAGSGGTLYGVSEQDGAIKWTKPVANGDSSSPAVSGTDVYVSYACNQAYDFSPPTGTPLWHHSTFCAGGGGKTAVLFGNRLYVRDSAIGNSVLNASNGSELGSFTASVAPAFSGSTGYFLFNSTLQARDVTSGAVLWSFTGDGTLNSAPIVDNGYVYIGSSSGNLYALAAGTGANVWTGSLGAGVNFPGEPFVGAPLPGLGAGDGLIVVPATNLLVAYQSAPQNVIDQSDFFVKQQYLDFLNRQPDQAGLDFWTNQITSCGSDAQCIEVRRVNTSGAFFLSIEFQQTGNLVYKMYKAGFGNLSGKPVAVDRAPFMADTRQIQSTPGQVIVNQGNWQAQLETNKQAFALAFVQRASFQSAHASQTAVDYVNSLFTNAGVSPSTAETNAAIAAFGSGGDAGRAAALRSVAESASVAARLNNEAFVLMQYFGYLQRNPYDPPESTLDYSGYNFWLGKLNQFNGDFIAAEMVKAFITSSEYRKRFGP